ncbi:MAG: hypothetical protein JXR66_04320 [Bacteroidales bacterium]|nr:hypothetical protein [Bacteroidales bacterium]
MRFIRDILPFLLIILLLSSKVTGQPVSDPASDISERFSGYVESVPWEEAFIHTDRKGYIAGELLWFKAYLVERSDLRLSDHSSIMYLELLDPAGKPVKQSRILLKGGVGDGNMKLSDTLLSGTYTIRAYTHWMRNFMPGNCFSKEITIYNSYKTGVFLRKLRTEPGSEAYTDSDSSDSLFDMKTLFNAEGDLEVLINTTGVPDYRENELFCLFVRRGGEILSATNEKMTAGRFHAVIPFQKLKPGLVCVTLFDFRNDPLCERYLYVRNNNENVGSDENVRIYGKRQKVKIETGPLFMDEGNETASLSVSVVPLTPSSESPDINAYLFFGTEYGDEQVRQPAGRRPGELPEEEMDRILRNLKSRWVIWENVFSGEDKRFVYPPEKEEHFIYATLMETEVWPALQDQVVIMSSPAETPLFQYAVTDTSGNFSMVVPADEYRRDLIIQPDDHATFSGIKLRSQFHDNDPGNAVIQDTALAALPPEIFKWSMNHRISAIYGIPFSENENEIKSAPGSLRRFYGKPGFELLTDDYTSLPLMEEVFFELVPGVKLIKLDSGWDIRLVDPLGNELFEEPPCLMIDGVIVKDQSLAGNLDPALLKKIDVITDIYMVDAFQFHGIVNLITRDADFSSVPLSGKALRLDYSISEPPVKFVSPEYDNPEVLRSRIPDFRNTMYWNPDPGSGRDGNAVFEFWTSDYASEYEICIQGISPDGELISWKKVFITEQK